ncbi:MAG: hypothetical protein JWM93_2935 [Frankiales bacterium]|nr:hypothetical protein [Frankiales bacterium]
MTVPKPSFAHLRRLTDDVGLFEHAKGIVPRRSGGYCVDDVARALAVVSREPTGAADPDPDADLDADRDRDRDRGLGLGGLADRYLAFVLSAQAPDGRFRNRFGLDRRWHDEPSVEDCWGRALFGLGSAAAQLPAGRRDEVRAAFWRGAAWRSPYSRAMAFAGLGAAEMLRANPDDVIARDLLRAAAAAVGRPRADVRWPWPEERLRYSNAALPEVLIAAGAALGDDSLTGDGLELLAWLLTTETRDGHLSVTPVAGRGRSDVIAAGFDQQPIEVAAIADACARAYSVTGDARWAHGVELAAQWFLGRNDCDIAMYDVATGGCCDGLEFGSRNENQGAESTLAALSTMQLAQRLQAFIR